METGKLFWETPDRYISRHMLLALVEGLDHDYRSLLGGAKSSILAHSSDKTLLEAMSNQVSEVMVLSMAWGRAESDNKVREM